MTRHGWSSRMNLPQRTHSSSLSLDLVKNHGVIVLSKSEMLTWDVCIQFLLTPHSARLKIGCRSAGFCTKTEWEAGSAQRRFARVRLHSAICPTLDNQEEEEVRQRRTILHDLRGRFILIIRSPSPFTQISSGTSSGGRFSVVASHAQGFRLSLAKNRGPSVKHGDRSIKGLLQFANTL